MNSCPLPSTLRRWVSRVGKMWSLRASLRTELHKVCATHSANGATARPHVGAVSESRAASGAINRQLPSRCSRNHSRLRDPLAIQSSRNVSTWGERGDRRGERGDRRDVSPSFSISERNEYILQLTTWLVTP